MDRERPRLDATSPSAQRRARGPDGDERADEVVTESARLLSLLRRHRHDESALRGVLSTIAPLDRQRALLALIGELGGARAHEVAAAAWDSVPPLLAASEQRVGEAAEQGAWADSASDSASDSSTVAASFDFALARSTRDLIGELLARGQGRHIDALVASLEPHVAGAAAVLVHNDPALRAQGQLVPVRSPVARSPTTSGTPGTSPASFGAALGGAATRHAVTLWRRDAGLSDVDAHHPAVEEALRTRGAGEPLPEPVKAELAARLGVRLDGVRVHTDAVAARAAEAIAAQAFTLGEDIFFAAGRFDASSEAGRRLIAHEVAHVAQAYRGAAPSTGARRVSDPGEALEREAERFADETGAAPASPSQATRRAATPSPRAVPALPVAGPVAFRAPGGSYDKQKLLDAMKAKDAAKAIELASYNPTSGLDDLFAAGLYPSFWYLVEGAAPHEGASKAQLAKIFYGYQGKTKGDNWSCKRRLLESQWKTVMWSPGGGDNNVDEVAELDNLYAAACKTTMAEVQRPDFIAKNRRGAAGASGGNANAGGANNAGSGTPQQPPPPEAPADLRFEYGKVDRNEPPISAPTLIAFADKWNKATGNEGKADSMFFVQPSTPKVMVTKKDGAGKIVTAVVKISWQWKVSKWKEGTANPEKFHRLEIQAYKDAHDTMVAHEDGHVEIDKSIYNDANIAGWKGKTEDELVTRVDELTDKANEENNQYDSRTGHGVNQTTSTSTHLQIPNKQVLDDNP